MLFEYPYIYIYIYIYFKAENMLKKSYLTRYNESGVGAAAITLCSFLKVCVAVFLIKFGVFIGVPLKGQNKTKM